MALPSFFKRSARGNEKRSQSSSAGHPLEAEHPEQEGRSGANLSHSQIARATRTRKVFALLTAFFLFLTVIFLILVEIGNTHIRPVLTEIYFLKLDLTNIIPISVPNAVLINSIARTLGLHDFYQVGLWNFCEGYNGEGVTNCSKPQTLYWFNPIEILLNELLAGASSKLVIRSASSTN
jgi:hypothetical protein